MTFALSSTTIVASVHAYGCYPNVAGGMAGRHRRFFPCKSILWQRLNQ
ncbi:hypothetical protein [Rhizobium freirei]|nr:hypothetical protein [Rhizobium freirei]